jgi:nitroreductase family protein
VGDGTRPAPRARLGKGPIRGRRGTRHPPARFVSRLQTGRTALPGRLHDLEARLYTLSADWAPPTVRADLLVHALEGVEPGAYRLQDSRIEPLSHGNFREVGRILCLEQPLGGDGAITCFLMTDLAATTEELGPRGYRAAQLEAGITAGRIYLGAYACNFGATGLTFYDDKVREFFKTPDEPLLVVALGHPAKGRRLM